MHIQRDRGCTFLLRQPVLREALQPDIDGQLDFVARIGLDAAFVKLANDPADRVHLDLAGARLAAQRQVDLAFHTGLADPEAGQAEHRFVGHIGLGDGAHIAQNMGRRVARRVIAKLAFLNGQTRQFRRVDLDAGDLLPAQILLDRHRHERRPPLQVAHDLLPLVLVQGHVIGQLVQRRLDVTGLLGDHDQPEILTVQRQRLSEPVDDQTPGRRQEAHVDAILLRQHAIARALGDLQIVHAPGQRAEQADFQRAQHRGAPGQGPEPIGIPLHHERRPPEEPVRVMLTFAATGRAATAAAARRSSGTAPS